MNDWAWRCFLCGAYFPGWAAACSACLESGTLVRAAKRPRAVIDGIAEVTTAAELAKANFTVVTSAAYGKLRLAAGVFVVVYGPPGGGKSSFVARFMDGLAGVVILQSLEELPGPSLNSRLARLHIRREGFVILGKASVDQTAELIRKNRAVGFALDSWQMSTMTPEEMRHLTLVLPSLQVVVAVSQVNARGRPEGRQRLTHEADVVIAIEKRRWRLEKSRFQEVGLEGPVLQEDEDEVS